MLCGAWITQSTIRFIYRFFFINFSLSFINIIDFISFAYTEHLSGIGMKTIVIVMWTAELRWFY